MKQILAIVFLLSILVMGIGNNAYSAEFKYEPLNFIKVDVNVSDLHSAVVWNGGAKEVTVYIDQVKEMKERGYSNTRILDLLALKSQECNKYNGDCKGYSRDSKGVLIRPLRIADYGPFQINQIHKDEFNTSLNFMYKKDWEGLYKYQLGVADGLVSSYMEKFCDWKWSKTNKNRFYCVAVSYNGSPRYKHTYKKIAWLKREVIKKYLFDNKILIHE